MRQEHRLKLFETNNQKRFIELHYFLSSDEESPEKIFMETSCGSDESISFFEGLDREEARSIYAFLDKFLD